MPKQSGYHSSSGIRLVRLLLSNGLRVFTLEQAKELAATLEIQLGYVPQALLSLRQEGWISLLHRGLYAISDPSLLAQPIHEFEIAMALAQPAAISFWSAFQHYGLTEQIPQTITLLTSTEKTPRQIGQKRSEVEIQGIHYVFVRTKPDHFFGVTKAWIGDVAIQITDLERTLLAGLQHPKLCGDFMEVMHAFNVARERLRLDVLIQYALRLGVSTSKRLGWVLERHQAKSALLEPLRAAAATSYVALDPSQPNSGACNRHWMVRENILPTATRPQL